MIIHSRLCVALFIPAIALLGAGATRANDELGDVPKWEGVTPKVQEEIDGFNAYVKANRREDENLKDAEQRLFRRSGISGRTLRLIQKLRTDAGKKQLLSDEYQDYLADNRALLERWSPSLYEAGYIREALGLD